VFFVVVKTKTYKITNIMHFSCAKTLFPGQSECFVRSSSIDYLIRIEGASYLNGYCNLMFLCMFFNVFSARQHAECTICYRKSVCPSVCHTGGSVENG